MPSDNGRPKGERIEERLEYIVSIEDKQRIDGILRQVGELTDVQKLLLYLKLPTGARSSGLNDVDRPSSNSRPDHATALSWLRTHLQLDTNTCLAKQDILDEYRLYCERHHYQIISRADFGKLVKQVFPHTKTRRLGQRGQSKHCYGGMGMQTCIDPPTLPDIDAECMKEEQVSVRSGEEDSLVSASSSLVSEWAQKLLGRDIPDVVELARYLVSNNYVNGQSHAAFAVLATVHCSSDTSPKGSTVSTSQLGSRPRDVHLQLQRKLQQRGQLRQQKKRLEEQRSRLSDGATTTDQQTDDSDVKSDKREETAPADKKELAEKPKEVVSSRVQPVLPKLILPKPASVLAMSRGPSCALPGTVSRPGVTTGEMSPSVLLLTPPANTHPQPMLYLSPQQNSTQQPLVLTPATTGQHWPVNSAPLALGPVLVSSVPQQTNCVARAVTSTAGAASRQCLQQPPRHQQLQQLLQQPPSLLPRQQAPTTTRALPRSEVKLASRVQANLKLNTHITAPISSVCHRPMGDSAVATVRAPVSLPSNQSTNVAANPCLAALICASPTRSNINGPLTFQGGLHLHADLAPGGVHLHTDLAPGGSSVSGAYMESRGVQNAPPRNPLQNDDRLEETVANICMTNAMVSGACAAQSHVSSPQHNTTQAETGVGSPASGSTPQKTTGKSGSSGKILKTPAKTVSTLLKEQRGYGPQEDQRGPYVKDKRPVSELLKESRIKRHLNIVQPRLVMLDAAQNGDGKPTPATTEPDEQFGNNDNSIVIVNIPGLDRQEAAANRKSHVLVSDSPRQSSWDSSNSATNRMIQLMLSNADESHGSGSSSSDGSVDMPVAERDSLLGCFSMDTAPDLADITPSINTVESCDIQSLSSTVATAPVVQMVGSRLQQFWSHNRRLEQDMQMKAMFAVQSQDNVQQQRNSAVSFSDCLAAAADISMRRPQSESSIEQYRHQQDDLTSLTQPPVAITSRPGSDISGVFANPSFQAQSFMNQPQKCCLPRSHAALNNVHVDRVAFAAERNPSASLMLSPLSTLIHANPATTPLSILSPKTHHQENGISGCQSFTPISGGVNFESRSFVSPVRPMATMGTVVHERGCVSVASDPERAPLKQVVASDLGGNRGFLPYAAATSSTSGAELSQMFPWLSDSVGATVPVMTYPQESPHAMPQTYNNDGHFAPVSSIRPVKRGRCGGNTTPAGLTKRARHHSAQSSFNVEASSTPLEGGGRACVGPAQNFAIRQCQPVESAAFSPEILHIMGSNGLLTSQAQAAYNVYRSRSVPAHHVVHDGHHDNDGSCQFSAAAPPDRSCTGGFMDEPSNEEITQLLQDKMDGMPGTARGLHVPPTHEYGARKNLTELLEGGTTHQEQQVYSSCRGDHMISGASWRPATLTLSDGARQRFRRTTSYPGEDAALTPPSSQNPTPVDFGGVVATADQLQSGPCSRQDCIAGGRTFAVATAMHTPSSMDVTGDGREALDDPLFSDVYDDDSSTTRGTADSVSPADQLVTDNQPMSLEWSLV